MNPNEFRKDLIKIMPGYKWTVHRKSFSDSNYLSATGIQSSGFNRLSTLQIIKRERNCGVEYEARSSGFGKNTPWLSDYTDVTLARALRGLQDYYERMAARYNRHVWDLKHGREKS